MPGAGQSMSQGPDDQAAHQRRVAEAHLGLGRVDVDVDVERVDLEEQHRRRMPVAGEEVGVGPAQGALQQPVLHRAAVDEQILVSGVAPTVGRQARVARQADIVPRLIDKQGIGLEVAAQQGGEALQPPDIAGVFRRQAQGGFAIEVEGEGDAFVRHGLTLDLFRDGHGLGALGLHEFEPGGGGVEQVADLDAGAVRTGETGGRDRPLVAALDGDGVGVAAVARAAGDGQPGDRADRGQGLAAKAERVNAQQVDVARVIGLELGGGVALDRQGQLVGRHAVPVVGDQNAG